MSKCRHRARAKTAIRATLKELEGLNASKRDCALYTNRRNKKERKQASKQVRKHRKTEDLTEKLRTTFAR